MAANRIMTDYQIKVLYLFVLKVLNLILILRPNKQICVFMVTCQKNLGSVGINFLFFLLSAKPEIVLPGIRFRYFIFEISGKPSFVEAVL